MDIFAHTLWTNAVFHAKYPRDRRRRYIATAFGVLPDLVSFVPIFIYFIFSGHRFTQDLFSPAAAWPVRYAAESYNVTHSLVIALVAIILVALVRRGKIYWPMCGWILHIIIDIFSHSPDFFPTPFLFPLSNYHNPHAVPWSNPVYMIINYSLLIIVYLGIFYASSRRKTAKARQTE